MRAKRTTTWILAMTTAAALAGRTAAAADETRAANSATTRRIVVSLPDRKLALLVDHRLHLGLGQERQRLLLAKVGLERVGLRLRELHLADHVVE